MENFETNVGGSGNGASGVQSEMATFLPLSAPACCDSYNFEDGCKPLIASKTKQWEILRMIQKTQFAFEKRSNDYSELGDCGINRPTCKKVATAYKNCADELALILSVIETIH